MRYVPILLIAIMSIGCAGIAERIGYMEQHEHAPPPARNYDNEVRRPGAYVNFDRDTGTLRINTENCEWQKRGKGDIVSVYVCSLPEQSQATPAN